MNINNDDSPFSKDSTYSQISESELNCLSRNLDFLDFIDEPLRPGNPHADSLSKTRENQGKTRTISNRDEDEYPSQKKQKISVEFACKRKFEDMSHVN